MNFNNEHPADAEYMTHNKDNKECEENKCGQYVNCNNYACEGEHPCTCPDDSTQEKCCGGSGGCGRCNPVTVGAQYGQNGKESWEEEFIPIAEALENATTDMKPVEATWDFIRTAIETAIKEERERIAKEVEKTLNEECLIYGTDKHGLSGEQLMRIITLQ